MTGVRTRIAAVMIAGAGLLARPASGQTRYLTGSVTMEDGSPPPKSAAIERYCGGGRVIHEGITDRKGRFIMRYEMGDPFASGTMGTAFSHVMLTQGMTACVLRAALPGYESSTIDLAKQGPASDPHLPPLVLLRRGSDGNLNFEAAGVPGAARKAWERAIKAAQGKNWQGAERELRVAVQAAPRFAQAWNMLGAVCQNGRKLDQAREAFRRAIESDPGLLTAYILLGRLDVEAQDWRAALETSGALIKADTKRAYPEAYFHDAVARYYLRDLDGAKASALDAVRLDRNHQFPRAEYVLGVILAAQRDYAGAKEHMGAYLELEPKAGDATAVRAHIANLGTQQPGEATLELNAADVRLSPAGEAWVPGGIKALGAAAHVGQSSGYGSFFSDYCRALIRNNQRFLGPGLVAYMPRLRAYFASVEELARAGERHGDRTVITLSLAPDAERKEAERILLLLGWKVVAAGGLSRIEIGDRPEDGIRHSIPAALGIDEISMQDELEAGRSFTLEVPSESARLPGGDAWSTLIKSNAVLPGGLAEAFARDLRIAKAYVGLSAIGDDTAAAVVAGVGLRAVVEIYADLLSLYSEAFTVSNGVVAVPGGTGAESVWTKLAGASPRDPAAFFRALLQKDHGALAAFYWALSRGDAAHQRFFVENPAHAARVYEWYRNSAMLHPGMDEPGADWQAVFLRELPLDESGHVRFPGGRRAWTASGSPDEDVQLALTTPQVLLAVAQLEQARGAPLDEGSAGLLARHYEEWRALFPYFKRLMVLGRAEFEGLAAFSDAVRNGDPAQRNARLGDWYSLVELIALGYGAGALDAQQTADAFRRVCQSLQASDFSAQALASLRAMTGEPRNLDETVPSGLLRLSGARRVAFDRMLRLQNVPRLESVLESHDDAKTLAALSGLVYAVWLDPDSLLVSEDPTALRRHRFSHADPRATSVSLFLPAALNRSGQPPGSYLSGGFADFEEVARQLPHASSAAEPAEAAPGADPQVVAPAAGEDAPFVSTENVFRANGRLVEVYATVTDGHGRYIDGLPRTEFTLLEEGTLRQITAFESNSSAVSCALLLDTTASMQAALPALKNAALKLIEELRETDSVAVYSFDQTVSALQPFTTEKQAAKRAVLRTSPGGETALYDALSRVAREISGRGGKKVIVVFTDGDDNKSMVTTEAAIRRAKTIGAAVYTVAQGTALHHPELLKQLSTISRATGGVPFAIREPREIRGVLESVAQDLIHGYLLAFPPAPARNNNWRSIEVALQGSKGYKVRAREGYYPE